MFCSLIKKVNISKSEKLYKIGTNKETNFIAIGGSNGFVQIVDLDVSADTKKEKGSQISFNQSLKYHNDDISLLTWNDNYNKLTTCDKSGVIVVWKFVDNKWETEMINEEELDFKKINEIIDGLIIDTKKVENRDYKDYVEKVDNGLEFEIEYVTKKKGKKKKHKK